MTPKVLTAATQIDLNVGFRYHTVYIYSENSSEHCHDYYEIFLVLKNDITHHLNGKRETPPRGSLVFIRKDDVHYYESPTSPLPGFVNFAFTEEILNQLFDFLTSREALDKLIHATHPPTVQLNETDITWVLRQFEMLNAIPTTDTDSLKYQSRILLFKLFTRYFLPLYINKNEEADIPSWLYNLNLEMQKLSNFSQSPDHMVAMSGKCRAYLGRMLKQYYNKTIPDYINDIRLNYWANCLTNSDAPIVDICYESGFENISWAYTLFKKKYGMSPLKYRKLNT